MNTDAQNIANARAPERPTPYVMRRDRLAHAAPHIEGVLSDLLAHIQEQGCEVPACPGVTVSTEYVSQVIAQHLHRAGIDQERVSSQTLILYLPAEFDHALEELVTTGPEVLNHTDTALRNNSTYLAWHCGLPGEDVRTDVWVPDNALTFAAFDVWDHRHPERWGWVPVIAMAGDTIAVGGFVVDQYLVCDVQAACMSAQSTMPEEVYSDEELAAAASEASEVGNLPWLYRRLMSGYGVMTLIASVYTCSVG